MSDVSFNEEPSYQQTPLVAMQPALVRLVIRWGFAKDEKTAHRFLIGVVIVAVIIAVAAPLLLRQKDVPLPAPVVPLPIQTTTF